MTFALTVEVDRRAVDAALDGAFGGLRPEVLWEPAAQAVLKRFSDRCDRNVAQIVEFDRCTANGAGEFVVTLRVGRDLKVLIAARRALNGNGNRDFVDHGADLRG